MKITKLNRKTVTAIQNCNSIPTYVGMRAKIIRNRVEVTFTLPITKTRLPFLFRVSMDGTGCRFINLPNYLEYGRYKSQLPAYLRQLVEDIENWTPEKAVAIFNLFH